MGIKLAMWLKVKVFWLIATSLFVLLWFAELHKHFINKNELFL